MKENCCCSHNRCEQQQETDVGNIGARNAEAAKAKLKQLGIRLVAEDTGLNYGRTVELHCDTGEFYIKSVGKPLKII